MKTAKICKFGRSEYNVNNMYQAPSKRKKRAQLTLVYLLMIMTVLSVVFVLVLVIMGYRFNRYDGKIEQGGLVQFMSKPSGANVYIDDVKLANQTPSKITTTAGDHTISIKKDGYHNWQKNVTVKAGGVYWIDYVRLIPNKPIEKEIASFSTVSGAIVSSDSKHILIKEEASQPVVDLVSVDSESPVLEKILLDKGGYTQPSEGKTQEFVVESWDKSGRYALIRHNYDDGKTEWLSLDTRGDHALRNITTSLGVKIIQGEFAYDNSSQMYVLTDAREIRRIDMGTNTLSGPLVANVSEFKQYGRTITYSTFVDTATKQRAVGYWTDGAKKPRVIRTYADTGDIELHLRVGRYFNKTYVLVSYGETLDVMSGDLPASDSTSDSVLKQVASLTVPSGAKQLGFSPDKQRFIYAQNGAKVVVFDLELQTVSTTLLDNIQNKPLIWVDNYHFIDTSSGLSLYEFDGTNRQVVVADTIDMPALITSDDKYMFSFVKRSKGVELVRTKLTIE